MDVGCGNVFNYIFSLDMIFLVSRHFALRLPGSRVALVKVFELHSVTVFV